MRNRIFNISEVININIKDEIESLVFRPLEIETIKYFSEYKAVRIYDFKSENFNYTACIKKDQKIKNLFYNNTTGEYVLCININYSKKTKAAFDSVYGSFQKRGYGKFPYNIDRNYEAIKELKFVTKVSDKMIAKKTDKYTRPLNYTFGIEFETSSGYIPESDCFLAGLIPLKDGSISGIEYGTIVLNKNKVALLKKQLILLSKYTNFSTDCSTHIHFGGYPLIDSYIYSLYYVCCVFQQYILKNKLFPKYCFQTHQYKSTGKDYTKTLPLFSSFSNFMEYLNGGNEVDYKNGLFNTPNEYDPAGERKWQIASRYHWVNFVNQCFYDKIKTIEFRIMGPTNSFNKLFGYLLIFNAILLFSEKIAKDAEIIEKKLSFEQKIKIVFDAFFENLQEKDFLVEVMSAVNYPSSVIAEVEKFIKLTRESVQMQEILGDYYGCINNDDLYEKTNLWV